LGRNLKLSEEYIEITEKNGDIIFLASSILPEQSNQRQKINIRNQRENTGPSTRY